MTIRGSIRGNSSLIAFFHRCSGEQARSVFRNRSSEVGSPCRSFARPSSEVGSTCRSFAGPSTEVGSPCRSLAGPSSEVGSPCRGFAGPSSEVGSPCRRFAGPSSDVGSPCRGFAGPSSEVGSLIYTGGGRPPSKGFDMLFIFALDFVFYTKGTVPFVLGVECDFFLFISVAFCL